ncbi:hypothetical protein JTE90_013276 [Oedothorax gibbosus]|uniref:Uncharacterized protein n=1 Tax=Oedothorax gibbosus TaxID=931172 RepID=A0AAV6VEP0_9ARAC|nr:hypothetical protein JTE90_013276 [Oedothorax gibbosus]
MVEDDASFLFKMLCHDKKSSPHEEKEKNCLNYFRPTFRPVLSMATYQRHGDRAKQSSFQSLVKQTTLLPRHLDQSVFSPENTGENG